VKELKHLYHIDREVLGSGAFGKVFMGHCKSNTHKVAIKVIDKANLDPQQIQEIL
jgi:serine/threonine protein kinase